RCTSSPVGHASSSRATAARSGSSRTATMSPSPTPVTGSTPWATPSCSSRWPWRTDGRGRGPTHPRAGPPDGRLVPGLLGPVESRALGEAGVEEPHVRLGVVVPGAVEVLVGLRVDARLDRVAEWLGAVL